MHIAFTDKSDLALTPTMNLSHLRQFVAEPFLRWRLSFLLQKPQR